MRYCVLQLRHCNRQVRPSVRPSRCLAAISTTSRQATVNRRRQHSATTHSASKRRCAIVYCSRDIATVSPSVCPSDNSPARSATTSASRSSPRHGQSAIGQVQTLYFGNATWTSTTTVCQLTDIKQGAQNTSGTSSTTF